MQIRSLPLSISDQMSGGFRVFRVSLCTFLGFWAFGRKTSVSAWGRERVKWGFRWEKRQKEKDERGGERGSEESKYKRLIAFVNDRVWMERDASIWWATQLSGTLRHSNDSHFSLVPGSDCSPFFPIMMIIRPPLPNPHPCCWINPQYMQKNQFGWWMWPINNFHGCE